MTILNRGLLRRGLLRRGLIGDDSPTTSSVFLDDWSQLFTSSELFIDAELWFRPEPVFLDDNSRLFNASELLNNAELWGGGVYSDTQLEFDTILIGDI
jgi:hypothetical protein